jgi:hypothetical protein
LHFLDLLQNEQFRAALADPRSTDLMCAASLCLRLPRSYVPPCRRVQIPRAVFPLAVLPQQPAAAVGGALRHPQARGAPPAARAVPHAAPRRRRSRRRGRCAGRCCRARRAAAGRRACRCEAGRGHAVRCVRPEGGIAGTPSLGWRQWRGWHCCAVAPHRRGCATTVAFPFSSTGALACESTAHGCARHGSLACGHCGVCDRARRWSGP